MLISIFLIIFSLILIICLIVAVTSFEMDNFLFPGSLIIMFATIIFAISLHFTDVNSFHTIIDKTQVGNRYLIYYQRNTFIISEIEVDEKNYNCANIGQRYNYDWNYCR
jgi:hypothetical protein